MEQSYVLRFINEVYCEESSFKKEEISHFIDDILKVLKLDRAETNTK